MTARAEAPTPEQVALAEYFATFHKFLKKWLKRFGFGDYRFTLKPLDESRYNKAWAECHFHHEEEHATFWLNPTFTFPDEQLEMLAIHEVAHGLAGLAQAEGPWEEVFCNRVARLMLPGKRHPNEYHWTVESDEGDNAKDFRSSLTRRQRQIVGLAIDTLPQLTDDDRSLLNERLFERLSLREIAERRGVHKTTVMRRLRLLITLIGHAIEEWEAQDD